MNCDIRGVMATRTAKPAVALPRTSNMSTFDDFNAPREWWDLQQLRDALLSDDTSQQIDPCEDGFFDVPHQSHEPRKPQRPAFTPLPREQWQTPRTSSLLPLADFDELLAQYYSSKRSDEDQRDVPRVENGTVSSQSFRNCNRISDQSKPQSNTVPSTNTYGHCGTSVRDPSDCKDQDWSPSNILKPSELCDHLSDLDDTEELLRSPSLPALTSVHILNASSTNSSSSAESRLHSPCGHQQSAQVLSSVDQENIKPSNHSGIMKRSEMSTADFEAYIRRRNKQLQEERIAVGRKRVVRDAKPLAQSAAPVADEKSGEESISSLQQPTKYIEHDTDLMRMLSRHNHRTAEMRRQKNMERCRAFEDSRDKANCVDGTSETCKKQSDTLLTARSQRARIHAHAHFTATAAASIRHNPSSALACPSTSDGRDQHCPVDSLVSRHGLGLSQTSGLTRERQPSKSPRDERATEQSGNASEPSCRSVASVANLANQNAERRNEDVLSALLAKHNNIVRSRRLYMTRKAE